MLSTTERTLHTPEKQTHVTRGRLALFAVPGKFCAVQAIAQVRAALVKNVDEKGRTLYMQSAFKHPFLRRNLRCVLSIRTRRQGLVITNVSADIEGPAGINVTAMVGNPILHFARATFPRTCSSS